MATAAIHAEFKAKLEQLGFGAEEIKVFGAIGVNVHIVCIGRDTADKWTMALSQIFPGGKVACVPHAIYCKKNRGTNLKPSMRKGWLIGARA
jgi:hypothetical protein